MFNILFLKIITRVNLVRSASITFVLGYVTIKISEFFCIYLYLQVNELQVLYAKKIFFNCVNLTPTF